MLFYSFEFLYLFLPATLAGYFLLGRSKSPHLAIVFLTLASLFYYSWWDYKYVTLITISILFNYYLGLFLRSNPSKLIVSLAVSVNLLLIGYFKYIGFFADIANNLFDVGVSFTGIVLPLAISFFTFQQIAWLLDNNAQLIEKKRGNFSDYCLFVLFFPQLIAGPIVHHSEMMPQFDKSIQRHPNSANIAAGMAFFIIGLGKKIIFADHLAPIADHAFDGASNGIAITSLEAWLGALAYTGQLYFDFSGYADMAIGLALLFNIKLPLNFDSPYKSLTISEFWRRWHMTLSRFLRDYIYIPLGGNRKGETNRHRNLMITMLLGGLWHGASWNFILWGGLHGLYLIINHFWTTKSPFRLPAIYSWLLTFFAVIFAWVFFRAENFSVALTMLQSMAVPQGGFESFFQYKLQVSIVISALGIACIMPNSQELLSKISSPIEVYSGSTILNNGGIFYRLNSIKINWSLLWLLYLVVVAVTSIYFLLDSSTINEFIYFQF
jgi:alginate O-acetyltransferase complex protein AlgI